MINILNSIINFVKNFIYKILTAYMCIYITSHPTCVYIYLHFPSWIWTLSHKLSNIYSFVENMDSFFHGQTFPQLAFQYHRNFERSENFSRILCCQNSQTVGKGKSKALSSASKKPRNTFQVNFMKTNMNIGIGTSFPQGTFSLSCFLAHSWTIKMIITIIK